MQACEAARSEVNSRSRPASMSTPATPEWPGSARSQTPAAQSSTSTRSAPVCATYRREAPERSRYRSAWSNPARAPGGIAMNADLTSGIHGSCRLVRRLPAGRSCRDDLLVAPGVQGVVQRGFQLDLLVVLGAVQ